jgi:hypothetical protein
MIHPMGEIRKENEGKQEKSVVDDINLIWNRNQGTL